MKLKDKLKSEKKKESNPIIKEQYQAAIDGINKWEKDIKDKIEELKQKKFVSPPLGLFGERIREDIDIKINELNRKLEL